jgi:hypothetical protein
MTETKHIARGTDLTLIVAGVLIVAAAWAWRRWGDGSYTPLTVGLAVVGVVCVLMGAGIVWYARTRSAAHS